MSRIKMPAIVPNLRFKTFFDLQTYRSTWSAQKRPWRLFSASCVGNTELSSEPAADVPHVSGGFHRPYTRAHTPHAHARPRHARTLLDKYVLTGEVIKPNKK